MIRNYNLCGRRFPLQLGVALVSKMFVVFVFRPFFDRFWAFFMYFLAFLSVKAVFDTGKYNI